MKHNFRLFLLILFFVIWPTSSLAPSVNAATPSGYLPYGLRIAPGLEITDPPQPFDRAVHGPPIANTRPKANAVGKPGIILPKRATISNAPGNSPLPSITPGSGDRGLWLLDGAGIYAANDARLDLAIPDQAIGTTIYAPTHMAPGGACIETVTAHWRYADMATTAHGHGWWDWCVSDGTGGWQLFEFMDKNWQDLYVRKLKGDLRYFTQVYYDAPSNVWRGMLYNFVLGGWEEKVSISGTNISGFGNTGWTMWESHFMMDQAQVCPTLPGIQAAYLQLYINGKWSPLTTSNSEDTLGPYGLCWTNDSYSFRLSPQLNSWLARTPR